MGTSLLSLRKKNIFMRASDVSASSRIGDKAISTCWQWLKKIHVGYEDEHFRLAQVSISCRAPDSSQEGSQEHHDSACSLGSTALSKAQCSAEHISMWEEWYFSTEKSNHYICLYFWLFVSSLTTPGCVTLRLPLCTMCYRGGSDSSHTASPIPVRELAWRKDDWISGQLGHFLTYSLGTKSSELSHYPSASSF